jgi:hypothetical protein
MSAATDKFASAAWFRERRATLLGIAVGTSSWLAAFCISWLLWPASRPVPSDERISYALGLLAGPATLILLMICSCFRLFDTPRAEDPLLGAESQRFKINQRVLTNTVEQCAAFSPLVLALAVRPPPAQQKLLPIAVTIWCAGRMMFWIGYHVRPHWRAPGFDWTFYTTALLAGWYVYSLI